MSAGTSLGIGATGLLAQALPGAVPWLSLHFPRGVGGHASWQFYLLVAVALGWAAGIVWMAHAARRSRHPRLARGAVGVALVGYVAVLEWAFACSEWGGRVAVVELIAAHQALAIALLALGVALAGTCCLGKLPGRSGRPSWATLLALLLCWPVIMVLSVPPLGLAIVSAAVLVAHLGAWLGASFDHPLVGALAALGVALAMASGRLREHIRPG